MSQFKTLEQKTRKSQYFTQYDREKNLLQYAQMCQDQEQIYNYMEENKIGIYNIEYWLARAKLAQRDRQFDKVQYILKKARQFSEIKSNPNYCLLQKYEKQLQKLIANLIHSVYIKGNNRNLREYEALKNKKIDSVRYKKFGDIMVYIDRQCRDTYKLESLIQTYEARCRDDKQYQQNQHQNQKKKKPLSWITKNRIEIIERFENKSHRDNQISQMIPNSNNLSTPKNRPKKNQNLDSREILKNLKFTNRSPTFLNFQFPCHYSQQNKQLFKNNRTSLDQNSYNTKEKIRSQSNLKQNQLLFSFQRSHQVIQQPDFQISFRQQDGRIQFYDEASKPGNQDQILKNVITQVQRQKYQPQFSFNISVSNIDSNKQNLFVEQIKQNKERERSKGKVLSQLKIEDVALTEIFHKNEDQFLEIGSINLTDHQSLKFEQLLNQVNNNEDQKQSKQNTIDMKQKKSNQLMLFSQRYQRNQRRSNISEQLSGQYTNPLSQIKPNYSQK